MITIEDIQRVLGPLIPDNVLRPRWDDLDVILRLPVKYDYQTIRELGSGLSTPVWGCGLANKPDPGGFVQSYETDMTWLRRTAQYIDAARQLDNASSTSVQFSRLGFDTDELNSYWIYKDAPLANNDCDLLYIDGPELVNRSRDVTVFGAFPIQYDILIDHRLNTKAMLEKFLCEGCDYNQLEFDGFLHALLTESSEATHEQIQLTERLCLFKYRNHSRARRQ